jgi:hypothetical protein
MSPDYPNPYESDESCIYTIQASDTQVIKLNFIDFEIEARYNECDYDYLEIFDGLQSNTSSLGKYCSVEPNEIVSSSNTLVLVFMTDASVNGRGFKANYSFIDLSNIFCCELF